MLRYIIKGVISKVRLSHRVTVDLPNSSDDLIDFIQMEMKQSATS